MNDSPTLATLFERVRIFLADGDFVKADEYCERILDMEPTNWEAYYYKFLAALNLKNEDMLSAVSIPFGNVPVFHKLTQYAPKDVMDRLAAIEAANYSRLMEAKFAEAQNLEKNAHTAFDFAKAAVAEKAIPKCNFCYLDGKDMKTAMEAFLAAMPLTSIGGALPAEDFYYGA